MVEKYEEVIEDWYKGSQEEDLTTYLCEKHVLKGQDAGKTHTHTDNTHTLTDNTHTPHTKTKKQQQKKNKV